MELLFPLLAVLLAVIAGWGCGLYLLVRWLKSPNKWRNAPLWRRIWAAGWVLAAQGWIINICENPDGTMRTNHPAAYIGIGMTYLAPLCWIAAFYYYRRASESDEKQR